MYFAKVFYFIASHEDECRQKSGIFILVDQCCQLGRIDSEPDENIGLKVGHHFAYKIILHTSHL